jgi:hypothetical protein
VHVYLHKVLANTAKQLSDLLDYENAQIAHSNERALNGLVMETKEENSKMRILSVSVLRSVFIYC